MSYRHALYRLTRASFLWPFRHLSFGTSLASLGACIHFTLVLQSTYLVHSIAYTRMPSTLNEAISAVNTYIGTPLHVPAMQVCELLIMIRRSTLTDSRKELLGRYACQRLQAIQSSHCDRDQSSPGLLPSETRTWDALLTLRKTLSAKSTSYGLRTKSTDSPGR